jgi:hypothetical protein
VFYPFLSSSVCPSVCHTFVNATPTYHNGFGWNLAQSKIMMPRCAWSEDFPVRRFLPELWPLTLTFSQLFLLNATPTFLDGFGWHLAQSKMMMPRCTWSQDFPFVDFCSLSIIIYNWIEDYCVMGCNDGEGRHQFLVNKNKYLVFLLFCVDLCACVVILVCHYVCTM